MSSLGVFSDECSTFLDMMNNIGIDKKQQLSIIKKMINIAIRATYFYISSDSFVLFGGNILHNPGINCLKSWVRLWLFEGKSGANEQLIKMRGNYVLICEGDKWLIPLHINTYYIFCSRNRNWDSPDLMQFWFLFFSFLFLFFFFCFVLFCF